MGRVGSRTIQASAEILWSSWPRFKPTQDHYSHTILVRVGSGGQAGAAQKSEKKKSNRPPSRSDKSAIATSFLCRSSIRFTSMSLQQMDPLVPHPRALSAAPSSGLRRPSLLPAGGKPSQEEFVARP
ncbi:hypothetical protein NL676_004682 [Syzygium grande]|nr:hypothetical protein NL676_004682 [Syzygium grande]